MGVLDKLMFWKKEEEFSFDDLAEKEMGHKDLLGQDSLGLGNSPQEPGFAEAELGWVPNAPAPSPTRFSASGSSPLYSRQSSSGMGASGYPANYPARERELELIDSKLETIKALLASLDQRIANLEKSAGVDRRQKLW